MKDSEFSLDDLKFTMRNMYVNGLHTKSGRQGRGSAMSADAARRVKSGLKCHSCGKTGHFQRECTTNTKKVANAPNAHNTIKPSKKGTASKTKWCSLHNTTSHNDAECKAQAVGKFSQKSPAHQTRRKGHNANAAIQEAKQGDNCCQGRPR